VKITPRLVGALAILASLLLTRPATNARPTKPQDVINLKTCETADHTSFVNIDALNARRFLRRLGLARLRLLLVVLFLWLGR
jgi:hypothetical protein